MDTSQHTAWNVPPWGTMWGLAVTIYFALKGLVYCTADRHGVTIWRRAAFLFAWPGMDAKSFLVNACLLNERPTILEYVFATTKLLSGLAVLLVVVPNSMWVDDFTRGWIAMTGIALSLHFGLFHLLSCIWRTCDIHAIAIMNWPILAMSLSDFWGRRWNLAFRDLTYPFIYRPLARRFGGMTSLMLAFLVSGLVHDIVISVPAKGGYGAPTVYFLLQGLGISLEKSSLGRGIGLGRGLIGRLFCAAVLLLPSGFLFHSHFISRVILPFVTYR